MAILSFEPLDGEDKEASEGKNAHISVSGSKLWLL